MTNQEDIEIIRTRFFDTFGEDIAVALDTETLTDLDERDTYARFFVRPGDETPRSVLPRRYDAKGRVHLYIFVPLSAPTKIARTLEQRFVEAFREWVSDDDRIRFEAPSHEYRESKTHTILETTILYRAIH